MITFLGVLLAWATKYGMDKEGLQRWSNDYFEDDLLLINVGGIAIVEMLTAGIFGGIILVKKLMRH